MNLTVQDLREYGNQLWVKRNGCFGAPAVPYNLVMRQTGLTKGQLHKLPERSTIYSLDGRIYVEELGGNVRSVG